MDFSWDFAKDALQVAAPYLGGLFGGPAGSVAAKLIADKVLGKPDASNHEIADVITRATTDPATMAKLQELEGEAKVKCEEFRTQVKKMETDLQIEVIKADTEQQRLAVENVKSARDMLIKLRSSIPAWLTGFILTAFLGFIAFFIVVTMFKKTEIDTTGAVWNMIVMAFTLVIREVTGAFQFWMGTSDGSKSKDTERLLSKAGIGTDQ